MLREGTEGQDQAWNRRGAGIRSLCRGRRGDAGRGGLHAERARSRRDARLRASNWRFRPQCPAKESAACFPREHAHANGPRDAKHLPLKPSVPPSNSSAAHSMCFPVSGSLCREVACGNSLIDLAASQSERLENPFVAECRLLVKLLLFTRLGRLWAFRARDLIVGHKLVKPVGQTRKAGLSPNFDKSKGSVL